MSGPIIPIHGGGEGPPPGGLGGEDWARGVTFLEFEAGAGAYRSEIEAAFASADAGAEAPFFRDYPRAVRVVALASADGADARFNIAHAERCFTLGPRIWMRIFDPARAGDLARRHAPDGRLPRFVFFDDARRAFATWGPWPRAAAGLSEDARRAYYARNRGGDLAAEIAALLRAQLGAGR